MGKGEWFDIRLGKPLQTSNFKSEWFDWFLKEVENYSVERGVVIWAIGGAGFIIKSRNTIVYIDPYCGGSIIVPGLNIVRRMVPIPFNPSDVKNIDATIITHEDLDHLNEDFVFSVNENTKCLFIGPPSVSELLKSWEINEERIVTLKEYEETKVKDIKVIALPSYDPIPKTANTYILEVDGVKIFHSGDSLFFEGYYEVGRKYEVDIALISLGNNPPGQKIYNNPGEVVQIARDLGAKILIPMHWDLWSFSLEDPHLVEREVKLRKYKIKTVILRIGEKYSYSK